MADKELQVIIKAVYAAKKAIQDAKEDINSLGKAAANAKTPVSGLGGSLSSASQSVNSIKSNLLGVVAPIAGVATAAIGAGVAIKGLADNFVDYALEVRDFANIIGATPEQASQLIQVADDVRISMDQLGIAMKSAIQRGLEPTIDGIAKMADAYLSIEDPIERSKYLLDTFGKSGLEMARMMELGGDAIIEMGKTIEGTGLEISQEDVDSATQYYQEIDKAADAWEGLKQELGKEVAPVVLKIVTQVTNEMTQAEAYNELIKRLEEAADKGIVERTNDWQSEYAMIYRVANMVDGVTDATIMLDAAWKEYYSNLGLTDEVLESIADGMDHVGTAGEEAATRGAAAWAAYQEKMKSTNTEKAEAQLAGLEERAKMAAEAAGRIKSELDQLNELDITIGDDIMAQLNKIEWSKLGGDKLQEWKKKVDESFAKTGDMEQYEQNLKDLAVAAGALQLLAGDTTKWELLESLKESGQFTKEELEKVAELIEEVKRTGKFDIESFLKIFVEVYTTPHPTAGGGGGTGTGGGGGTRYTQAAGGPVVGGQSYWIGEAGPEFFTPDQSGYVYPASQSASAAANSQTNTSMNLTIYSNAPTEDIVRDFETMRAWALA